ncbi:hypothetical protein [Chengkuizengella axinellae]|uniref:Flagellar protein FlbD n=1 Tax=Chengkuizengella axinellae TaxID=3064388 RepID=A0ABT9IW12_9BACL|nr:hypothetical protein [Chengkuizengella sp. 2205SS18-9]MDP5273530.1 hypothetical protein [Chengkuizengella sp. 2205SS18-9]
MIVNIINNIEISDIVVSRNNDSIIITRVTKSEIKAALVANFG